ncbi:MAG: SLC13 family permease, partial [Verrucomicrobiota bacterium]
MEQLAALSHDKRVTFEIVLLLALVLIALVFFSFEWVSSDVVALGLVLTLILTGLLPAKDAFAGFGSDTVLMILGLLIMTTALMKTGVVDLVGRAIIRHAGTKLTPLFLVIMLSVATLSAFISNTAAAAFFLPVVLGVAAKSKVSPSKLLLPVAFASILTSSVTLISTSTNLVISGLMTNAGLKPMGMFELAPVGIPIAVAGLIYMFFIGRWLLPDRAQPDGLLEEFGVRSYITEVLVLPASPLVGKTLKEANLGRDLDLAVVRVLRDEGEYLWPRRDLVVRAGDVLLVEGARKNVLKVKDTAGIEIRPDVELSDPDLRTEDLTLVEALVVPGSNLIGRTLRAVG